MPLIKLYDLHDHSLAGKPPCVFEAATVAEWLLSHYGEAPRVNGNAVTVQVFEGEPSIESEITGNMPALMSGSAEFYSVLQSPGGSSVSNALNFVFPLVFAPATAVSLLTRMPEVASLASGENNTASSPNNQLSNRSNRARILQRIEDIYGTVRSIPSLIAPTYKKYINHIEYEYAYMCIGRGYYDIDDVRDGDTLLEDISGARAAVFDPFTSPNSGDSPILTIGGSIEDDVLTVTRSNEIDGITLKALNQLQPPANANYDFITAATAGESGDVIRQNGDKPIFESILAPGDLVNVSVNLGSPIVSTLIYADDDRGDGRSAFIISSGSFNSAFRDTATSFTVSGFTNPANNGTFTIYTTTATQIVVNETLVDESAGATITITNLHEDYSGTYEVDSVNNDEIVLTTSTFSTDTNDFPAIIDVDGVTEYSSWITLPQADRTQVWCNVIAPNGMYKDSGSGKEEVEVEFEVEIQQLDEDLEPMVTVNTATETLSGATTDQRATTLEVVTTFTGPCRFRIRRITNFDYTFSGTVIDEIKIVDLYAVTPVDNLDFGNITTIQTVTKATIRAAAARERQLNCLASRKLPTYNGSTFSGAFDSDGLLVSGTISATSKFVDIVAAISVDPLIGNRNLSTDVDIAQIYATYQAVATWAPEYAEFNYTFDSDRFSYEETIKMIANTCFCVAYRQNGKVRFAFDTAQSSAVVTTFCHRNKKPDSETITRNFAADSDYDGIELVYMDPDTERNETIKLPLDLSATKYKKIEMLGVRHFSQAWIHANREYERLKNMRVVIETVVTADARALLPNARIDVVDDTRFKRYGGEVIAQNGLELTLSQDVDFTPSASHSILLKKRNGDSQGITCTAGSAANKVILASPPSEAIITTPTNEDGIRTIYSFASDSQRAKQAYLVQELIPQDRQYVQVRAINYAPEYYQHDNDEIPDKDTVIYS